MKLFRQEVATTLAHHGAIVLRGQRLNPREQVEYTSSFGEPAGNPQLEFTVPEHPKVFVISNKIVEGNRSAIRKRVLPGTPTSITSAGQRLTRAFTHSKCRPRFGHAYRGHLCGMECVTAGASAANRPT